MDDGHDDEIVQRELDTDAENPAMAVVEVVADLEGTDATELATAWGCIDDVLDAVFSNPPAPEAQVQVTFSYEGYRITVEQNGRATFVEMA